MKKQNYDLAKIWVESQTLPELYLQDQEGDTNTSEDPDFNERFAWNLEGDKKVDMLMQPTLPDLNSLTRRKSNRQAKPSIKAQQSQDKIVQRIFGLATVRDMKEKDKQTPILTFMTHLENIKSLFDDSINECNFCIYNAVASTNDVYTLKEMLRLKNIREFVAVMMKEIADHEERDHWMLMKDMIC